MKNGDSIFIEPAHNIYVTKNKDGSMSVSAPQIEGQILFQIESKTPKRMRLKSPELYNWLKARRFSDIVIGNIAKISGRNMGNGIMYSATDTELVNQFLSAMEATTFSRVSSAPLLTGSSGLGLYDNKGIQIGSILFQLKGIVRFNNIPFKINTDIEEKLRSFFREFYSNKNAVKNQ